MAEETIRISGDASGAIAALRDLQGAVAAVAADTANQAAEAVKASNAYQETSSAVQRMGDAYGAILDDVRRVRDEFAAGRAEAEQTERALVTGHALALDYGAGAREAADGQRELNDAMQEGGAASQSAGASVADTAIRVIRLGTAVYLGARLLGRYVHMFREAAPHIADAAKKISTLAANVLQLNVAFRALRTIAIAGAAFLGLAASVAAAGAAVYGFTRAIAAHGRANAETAQGIATLENSYRSLMVSIGRLMGTGAELRRALDAISLAIGELTAVAIENQGALSGPVREAMALAMDAASLLTEAVIASRRAFIELRRVMQVVAETGILLANVLVDTVLGPLDDVYRRLNDIEQPMERFRRRMSETTAEVREARTSHSEFADTMGRVSGVFALAAARIRDGQEVLRGFNGTVDDAINRFGVLRALMGGGGGAANLDVPSFGGAEEDAKGAAQAEYDRQAEITRLRVEGLQARAAAQAEAAQAEQARLAEKLEMDKQRQHEHAQNLIQIEEWAAQKRSEIAQREADEAAALLQERQDMAREYASSIGGLISELAGGQRKALEVIKQFIGQELVAKGTSNLLEAAAMAFKPGMQVMAAGLAAASVAMIAAGAKLSKSGGGARSTSAASAGTAPLPQAAGQAERRNTEVNVSFGVVGDPRRAAGMVADMVREANRDGYTAGAA